jgi:glutamine amidotransferase
MIIVDYDRGNLFSLKQALEKVGAQAEITSDPAAIATADKIVFPGVGAFKDAMDGLKSRGLVEPLLESIRRGTPLLGICVGCQLLLTKGEEFTNSFGLNVISGTVKRLPLAPDGAKQPDRIPNVGWRLIQTDQNDPILSAVRPDDYVYFVHSFAPYTTSPNNIVATLDYNGQQVPVAVRQDNVVGVQFHPEKSGDVGLNLLRAFQQL